MVFKIWSCSFYDYNFIFYSKALKSCSSHPAPPPQHRLQQLCVFSLSLPPLLSLFLSSLSLSLLPLLSFSLLSPPPLLSLYILSLPPSPAPLPSLYFPSSLPSFSFSLSLPLSLPLPVPQESFTPIPLSSPTLSVEVLSMPQRVITNKASAKSLHPTPTLAPPSGGNTGGHPPVPCTQHLLLSLSCSVVSASPGNLIEMPIFGSHPKSPESKTPGVGPVPCVLTSLPGDSNQLC